MKEKLLLVLAVLALLAGCETGGARSGGETSYYPVISDVPPSFYNDNPSLRDWYTAPYWNPDAGP
jgi:ABC-type oligopeptide transport system substrate-binding subunit